MNAVDGHDLHVWRPTAAQKDAGLFEERLVDNGEVVGVEFGHMADAFHNLDEGSFHASKEVATGRVVWAEEAGAFDGAGELAGPGNVDAIHGVGQVDEGRWDEVDEGPGEM